jgi:hypothetical protein
MPAAALRAPVDGDELAEDVALADLQLGLFPLALEILRDEPD